MAWTKHVGLYVGTQLKQKYRAPCVLFCEIVAPVLGCLLLALLWSVSDVTDFPAAVYTTTFTNDTMGARDCASIADSSLNTYLARYGQNGAAGKLAIVPDTADTRAFAAKMEELHPGLPVSTIFKNDVPPSMDLSGFNVPGLANLTTYFADEASLNSYVEHQLYGKTGRPFIAAAIVFHSMAPNYNYSIRLNSSFVQGTTAPYFDEFAQEMSRQSQNRYMSGNVFTFGNNGRQPWLVPSFASLQRLVNSVILGPSARQASAVTTSAKIAHLAAVVPTLAAIPNVETLLVTRMMHPSTSHYFDAFFEPMAAAPQATRVCPFPTAAYSNTDFFSNVDLLPIILVLSFLYPVSRLVRGIVVEKEQRIREGMAMMGMKPTALMAGWYVTYFGQATITCLLVTWVLGTTLYQESDGFLLFLFFELFMLSVIPFTYCMSTLFSRSKTAAVLAPVLFLGSFFVGYATYNSLDARNAGALLPTVGFYHGFTAINSLAADKVGISGTTLSSVIGDYTVGSAMLMFAIDTVLYTFLGWYMDRVVPSEYGVALSPFFIFDKNYWMGAHSAVPQPPAATPPPGETGSDEVVELKQNIEEPSEEMRRREKEGRCISIRGLTKQFQTPDGVFTAVNNLNLTMYESQIFALLGHNGAGKTTTLSILSGLYGATSGHASILNMNIATEMPEIRKVLGVCPQHDVLWPDLTVKEHLTYFARLKGVAEDQVDNEVMTMIRQVGLVEKTDVFSAGLSGGQKRKLSVGIALIGGSKVVILDEPTSGMDPYSRRSTWEVIKNVRKDRIIILTTHHLDEADILGDTIAIMADGDVQCCGSSMFLKSRYGVGYSLTFVKSLHETREIPEDKEAEDPEPTSTCDPETVAQFVRQFAPTGKLLSNVGRELSFQLPFSASGNFPQMFDALEDKQASLGFESVGISVTTLEEVFLKVGHGETNDEPTKKLVRAMSERTMRRSASIHTSEHGADIDRGPGDAPSGRLHEASSIEVFFTHFVALLTKRFHVMKRDKKALSFQILLPGVLTILALILMADTAPTSAPSLPLTTEYMNDLLSVRDNPMPYMAMAGAGGLATTIMDAVPAAVANPVAVPAQQYIPAGAAAGLRIDNTQRPWVGLGSNLSYYLLDSRASQMATRYGAFGFAPVQNTSNGPSVASTSAFELLLLQNTTAYHAPAIFLNVLADAQLKATSGNPSASIAVNSYPMPLTSSQLGVAGGFQSMLVALIMAMAFSFIPASQAMLIVKEREVSAKHQQLISGVSIPAYWASAWAWDILAYICPFLVAIICFVAFDVAEFVEDGSLGASALLFALYGPATASFTYVVSFAFKKHSNAQNGLLVLNLVAVLCMLVMFIMHVIPSTCEWEQGLLPVLRLIPSFSLANALLQMSLREFLAFGTCDAPEDWAGDEAFAMNVTGANLWFLAVSSVVYFLLAVGIDVALGYPSIRAKIMNCRGGAAAQATPTGEIDEDVAAEAERVRAQLATAAAGGAKVDDAVIMSGLRKHYGSKQAIRELSFGIPRGECFGFLGINGAGKTTSLKILSGDIIASEGEAKLGGFDIMTQQLQVRRLLGYCPQFDALLELLSVREHLELFARIKGVPKKDMKSVVDKKIREMDLQPFERKLAGRLSGGNKRKLSVAIAMIGDPPIVMLDEPSTGMDPMARRHMWTTIEKLAERSSVILTTHSMEECEALCSRVGIMVGGRLRCLGSVQHLKNRFGKGFQLDVKLESASAERTVGKLQEMAKSLSASHPLTTALNATASVAVGESKEAAAGTASATHDVNNMMASASDVMFDRPGLTDLLKAVGHGDWVAKVHPDQSGWSVDAELEHQRVVSATTVVEWLMQEEEAGELMAFVNKNFTGSDLLEEQDGLYRFRLPAAGLHLGPMFALMEGAKESLHMREYALSQVSLEQIFNSFASQQEEEKGRARGMIAQPGAQA